MGKMVNCKICGTRCEEKKGIGVFGLPFGIPIKPSNLCCDACVQEWHGEGRIWYGKRWKKQSITTIVVLIIAFIVYMCFF